jgi:hypothetical protein
MPLRFEVMLSTTGRGQHYVVDGSRVKSDLNGVCVWAKDAKTNKWVLFQISEEAIRSNLRDTSKNPVELVTDHWSEVCPVLEQVYEEQRDPTGIECQDPATAENIRAIVVESIDF